MWSQVDANDPVSKLTHVTSLVRIRLRGIRLRDSALMTVNVKFQLWLGSVSDSGNHLGSRPISCDSDLYPTTLSARDAQHYYCIAWIVHAPLYQKAILTPFYHQLKDFKVRCPASLSHLINYT